MEKIVQLSSVHISSDTRIFHKICKSLVNNGYEVDLIIQHTKDEIVDGISIVALPIATKKIQRLTKILPAVLKKVIKYSKKTIIHFHDPELIPFGIIFKLLGYKVIYDVHEDVPKDILTKEWIPQYLRAFLSFAFRKLEAIAIPYFDAIIVVTKSIGNRFSKRTTLIQNYPILKHKQIECISQKKRRDLFYVGSISEVRGINEMLEAVRLVNLEIPIEIKIAGFFASQKIENKVKSTAGWEKTNFFGHINRIQLKELAESSLIGLVIFHPIPNHIEAQPNKLFEYMQYGLPVVGSCFPLWQEIVDGNNCGILVDPLNTHEIAEAIKWLYNHPKEAKLMGENGRKAVIEKYNWHSEEKKLFKLYEEISSL